jgi:coenzyme PQQ precursor peptide PqqA
MRQSRAQVQQREGGTNMWHKPKMIEICTGAEINSYISAGK